MRLAYICAGEAELMSSVDFTGKPVETVLVTISLSRPAAAKQVAETTVEVAGDHVYVQSPGHKPLELQLPFSVSAQGATASWKKDARQIHLNLPYLSCRSLFQQVSGNKDDIMHAINVLALVPPWVVLASSKGCDLQAAHISYQLVSCLLQLATSKQQQVQLSDLAFDSYLELET